MYLKTTNFSKIAPQPVNQYRLDTRLSWRLWSDTSQTYFSPTLVRSRK